MNTENYNNVSIGWMNAKSEQNLVKFLFISGLSVTIGIDNASMILFKKKKKDNASMMDPIGLEREAHHNLF